MFRGHYKPDALSGERYFRWRGGEVSRLEGLSDALFALALTLLVVRLEVPRTYAEVEAALLRAPVYLACFAVFLWIWFAHFQFHRRYGMEDPLTVALDGALLFVVLLFALPLRFVADLVYSGIVHGDMALRDPEGIPILDAAGASVPMMPTGPTALLLFYAGGFALVFALLALQTWRAGRRAELLELDDVERVITRSMITRHLASTGIGLVALALAALTKRPTLAGMVFFALGPLHGVLGFVQGRAIQRAAAD